MSQGSSSSRTRVTKAALLVVLAAALPFAQTLAFDFAYDDAWTIVHNEWLTRPLHETLWLVLSGNAASRGVIDATRPAMIASMWIDRQLFFLAPEGYHLHSLGLYCGASALAYVALLCLVRDGRAALFGALFFAVAPIHAEVVAAVNYREDLIAGVALIGALAWVFRPRRRPERPAAAWSVALLWLWGLFGKESAVALVPIAAAIIAIERPEARWFTARRPTWIAFASIAVLWGSWRAWLYSTGRDDVPLSAQSSFFDRLLRTARFEVRSVVDSVAPYFWSPEHASDANASPLWLIPFATLVGVALVLARRRRTRPLAVGLAVALLAPLPMSPLVGPLNETADRYAFVGVLGGALFWGWVGRSFARRLPKRAHAPLAAIALGPGLFIGFEAAAAWQNDLVLWTTATERAPHSARAWTGLSRALRLGGRLAAADRAVDRAIELDPGFLRARLTRTYNLLERGRVRAARREIQEIYRLGGTGQRGLRRAERCAELSPSEAVACIKGAPPPTRGGERP